MFKRLISATLIFGAAALAPPADAQTLRCMPRDALVEKLQTRYDERLIGGGLQNPTQLLEIWSSDQTGSFTVFITRPDGTACLISSGQHWSTVAKIGPDGVAG